MKLSYTTAPPPDGFTEEWNDTIWTYGFLFVWSKFYEQWMRHATMISVRPSQSLADAYAERVPGHELQPNMTIFFPTGPDSIN